MVQPELKFMKTLVLAFMLALAWSPCASAAGIDPVNKWAWSENTGWINFNPSKGHPAAVYDDHLEGYAWSENTGFIRLGSHTGGGAHTYANNGPGTYGVNNDGAGHLSGHAWGENIGWINFSPTHGGVSIDPATGRFSGHAWSESLGWISFNGTAANGTPYGVRAATANAPTAEAGGPYTGNEGAAITLSAHGSSDPDNNIQTYKWDLDNDGSYDDATGVAPAFTWNAGGTYTIGLLVTDATGASHRDTATVTVIPLPSGKSEDLATKNGIDWAATNLELSSNARLNSDGAGISGGRSDTKIDAQDHGALTISFNPAELPYGVDNLLITMGDFRSRQNDSIKITVYDPAGTAIAIFVQAAADDNNRETIDLTKYAGIGSIDLAPAGGQDCQLCNVKFDPAFCPIPPRIISAVYSAKEGVLMVTGTHIPAQHAMDINVSLLTLTGRAGSHPLTPLTPNVNRDSETGFTVAMAPADRAALMAIMDKDGMAASDGTPYNLSAADDWCTRFTMGDTSDPTGNPVEVINANRRPHLSVAHGAFTEGHPATDVDAAGTAGDADGDTDWDTGAGLTIQITDGAHAHDELAIDTTGNFTISSGNLFHSGTVIAALADTSGTHNDGIATNGDILAINFRADATNTIVQELVRAVTYRNTSLAPTADAAIRTVTFTLNDKEGLETTATPTITITPVNQAPALTNPGLTGAHALDEGATAAINPTHLTALDPDDQGTGLLYTVTALPVNGTLWMDADGDGRLTPGEEFTKDATFTQADLDNNRLRYTHDGGETLSDTFLFTLADGGEDGVPVPTEQIFTITVNGVNDAPVINDLDGDSCFYRIGDDQTVMDQPAKATVTDADSIDFYGGILTVSIPINKEPLEDVLTIDTGDAVSIDNDGSVTMGHIVSVSGEPVAEITADGNTGNDLELSFNQAPGNTTLSQIQEIIRALAYHNTNTTAATESTRTVRFVLTDGDGGASAPSDVKITVTANLPPSSENRTITIAVNGIHSFNAADFPFSDPEGDALRQVSIVTTPNPGTLALAGTPVTPGQDLPAAGLPDLTFTPAPGQSGSPYASFSFTVNDGTNDSLPQTMTINVSPLDSDGDGTPDCNDNCPDDPGKINPGTCGCGTPDIDSDKDGTPDCNDNCPNDPGKIDPGTCGCGTPDIDSDKDGKPDCNDNCPNDPGKIDPGTCGCGTPDIDSDKDGTPDCNDNCPDDPDKINPGTCGCGTPDIDSDKDGTPDCNDNCPNDPGKIDPGTCGCGTPDIDSDKDGTPDCNDNCPNDPDKINPGTCGCGTPDIDSDKDGTPDCNDNCPDDPDKIDPGTCGCGTPDIDSDKDGTPDCNDNCPDDPDKINPGTCGCGTPDIDSDKDGTPDCNDNCPDDPDKINPGTCGCGTPDIDSDKDGTPDCNDNCPNDPGKIDPGTCGCGTPDIDSDKDGTPDCNDIDDPLEITEDNTTVRSDETRINKGIHAHITIEADGRVNNRGTLSDLTNNGTISGGTVTGDTTNNGRLHNVTLATGTRLTNRGGEISGTTRNNGAIFGGAIRGVLFNNGILSGNAPEGSTDPATGMTIETDTLVSDGQLQGPITNNGILHNVTLGEETVITFGATGRLTGTVVVFFEDGGAYPITIPEDVIFPSLEDSTEKKIILTPQFLLKYAKAHDWRINIHSSRMVMATAGITELPPISEEYILINGLVLAPESLKAASSVAVGIPYELSDLPAGYGDKDLLALVYDAEAQKWTPAPFTLSDSGTMEIRTDTLSACAAVLKLQAVTPDKGYILGALDGDTTEKGGTATFTLALASCPSADVTIGISSSDPTEGTVSPPSITFTPATWDSPRTVALTGIDDGIVDGNQPYYAVLAPAVSQDLNYNGVAPGNVAAQNRDNDLAPCPLAPIKGEVVTSSCPTLKVSALSAPGFFANHTTSCWQVATASEFGEDTLILEIASDEALTALKIPEDTCRADTTYYWRVKCTDDEGVSTLWSQPAAFTTPNAATKTEGDGGGGSGGCFIRALL